MSKASPVLAFFLEFVGMGDILAVQNGPKKSGMSLDVKCLNRGVLYE